MNIKVACPHCQVVGVVPENLKYASDWPVACHHCHQHYYVPVVASPAPLSRQIELRCSDCGRELHSIRTSTNQLSRANSSVLPRLPRPTPKLQNEIVELYHTEAGYFNARQAIGMRTGLAFVFLGFLSSACRSWHT